MKNTILYILAFQLIISSCNEVSIDDLQGKWSYLPTNDSQSEFLEFIIKENSIELIFDDLYKDLGKVNLNRNFMGINLNRENLKLILEIKNIIADTLVFTDNSKFLRNRHLINADFEPYDLINISTEQFLSDEVEPYNFIHFYKSTNNELRLRCGDKIAEFSDLPLYLSSGHGSPFKTLVFVGQGIELVDLQQLYLPLAMSGYVQVTLGTKKVGLSDTAIFEDYIEFWWDDLEEFRNTQNPMPPPLPSQNNNSSKQTFLKDDGEEIIIKSAQDIPKLKSIKNDKKYVIVLKNDLSIKYYLEAKRKLTELRKSNKRIKTSIE